jgi:hypothetical protein
MHKIGELVAAKDKDQDESPYVVGIISGIAKDRKIIKYRIIWCDDYTCEELWDDEQVATFKKIANEVFGAKNEV